MESHGRPCVLSLNGEWKRQRRDELKTKLDINDDGIVLQVEREALKELQVPRSCL